MTKTLIAIVAVAAYIVGGMTTYNVTAANSRDVCIAAPSYVAHVIAWPLSYGASAGLRSAC